MTEKDQSEAIIRILSNRCRNLRKAIDRTRTLRAAEESGQILKDEQRESVRELARKEALLAELQEILKKQTALLHPPPEHPQKLSRRAEKAARAKARDLGEKLKSASEKESEDSDLRDGKNLRPDGSDHSVEFLQSEKDHNQNRHDLRNATAPSIPNGIVPSQNAPDKTKTHINHPTSIAMGAAERAVLLREMADLKLNHERQLLMCRADAVRKTINLFHVAEFLRQPPSREALLSYYETEEGTTSPLVLSALHVDLVSYFNVMLTSPNGSVPHATAVDVSTAHCLGYMQGSTADAFKGTPYSMLVEIVNTIANCPILTDRGLELEHGNNHPNPERGPRVSKTMTGTRAIDTAPGHVVNDPVTDANHS